MTILEALDAVLAKHFGTPDFGIASGLKSAHFWSRLILKADLDEDLSFGVSQDALKVEGLQHSIRKCLNELDALTPGTRRYHPKSRSAAYIAMMLTKPGTAQDLREVDAFAEGRAALEFLYQWLGDMRRDPPFRKQPHLGRNWRAASVAATCRTVWGHAQWHACFGADDNLNALTPLNEGESAESRRAWGVAKARFILSSAPTSERHDAPGPFGRFLEDVFQTLGVVGKDGGRVSAHSALRALASAER